MGNPTLISKSNIPSPQKEVYVQDLKVKEERELIRELTKKESDPFARVQREIQGTSLLSSKWKDRVAETIKRGGQPDTSSRVKTEKSMEM